MEFQEMLYRECYRAEIIADIKSFLAKPLPEQAERNFTDILQFPVASKRMRLAGDLKMSDDDWFELQSRVLDQKRAQKAITYATEVKHKLQTNSFNPEQFGKDYDNLYFLHCMIRIGKIGYHDDKQTAMKCCLSKAEHQAIIQLIPKLTLSLR
jgi:hypothetical protein